MKSNIWPPPDPARRFIDDTTLSPHISMSFNLNPCLWTWPCRNDETLDHLCIWGRGHRLDHKCQCGAEMPR